MKVTVLGTGVMGTGVAHSLLREGHEVTVWNRSADKARALGEDGARVAASVSDAVGEADAVVVTLFDAGAVLDVLRAGAAALRGGSTVVVQASTIGLDGTAQVVELARTEGIALVEAMMLGTKAPAEKGALVLLTAGDAALLDRVDPVFAAIGSRTLRTGDEVGRGTALKLACNAWVAGLTASTAQSIALAQALGLDPQLFLDAIGGTPTDSPYAHAKGAAMIGGDLTPSFAVDGMRKDVALIRDAAAGAGVATTLLDALAELFAQASRAGHGADDIAAVHKGFAPGR